MNKDHYDLLDRFSVHQWEPFTREELELLRRAVFEAVMILPFANVSGMEEWTKNE